MFQSGLDNSCVEILTPEECSQDVNATDTVCEPCIIAMEILVGDSAPEVITLDSSDSEVHNILCYSLTIVLLNS
jgi:hypothetical protein